MHRCVGSFIAKAVGDFDRDSERRDPVAQLASIIVAMARCSRYDAA